MSTDGLLLLYVELPIRYMYECAWYVWRRCVILLISLPLSTTLPNLTSKADFTATCFRNNPTIWWNPLPK